MVDAVIIFLLAVQASMIFPALNWWPHPVRWFRSLDSTEKFTFVVAVFTAVLALATCVQVWAFIQSERAFLVVDNPRFRTGEPTADRPDLIMTLKNPGKKVAAVQEFFPHTSLDSIHKNFTRKPKINTIKPILEKV